MVRPGTALDSCTAVGMPRRAASLVKKTEQVRVFDPAQNLGADAWKFDYRLYYDLFIRESLSTAVYVYVY